MKSTFKKVLASTAIIALSAGIMFNVNAAALTVDSVTYDDGADTITVADASKDYDSDNIATLRVTDEDAATVADITVADVSANNNGSFVVS
ncbi:MAG: hypothetical protein GY827_03310 [Cytophagales bacterium]|nr:hypothetical protein [Cytophagales bacterium]